MADKAVDPEKMTDKQLDAHRAALQNDTDTTPLGESEEVFDQDGPTHAPAASKKNGLPEDEPLRRSITDPDLIVSETSGRQFRRQWDADEDGVEITGTERWVEVEYRGATELAVED